MRLAPLILILLAGCAVNPQPQPSAPVLRSLQSQSVVTPPQPFPVIVRNGLSKTNFTIQWPDEFTETNYIWSFEVASNVGGPWWTADQSRQPDADTNAFIKMHGAKFIRLKGTNS